VFKEGAGSIDLRPVETCHI